MILWRVLAQQPGVPAHEPGGSLFFPRSFQGAGRHDNPARFGCLYVSTDATSAVVEAVARFRGGAELREELLVRGGRRLSLAELHLADEADLVDLDEPRVLTRERLRPSTVATHERTATQAYAERLFEAHPDAAGIRWWSTFESSWMNVTLFDRAARRLKARGSAPLTLEHPAVVEAAEFLGLS